MYWEGSSGEVDWAGDWADWEGIGCDAESVDCVGGVTGLYDLAGWVYVAVSSLYVAVSVTGLLVGLVWGGISEFSSSIYVLAGVLGGISWGISVDCGWGGVDVSSVDGGGGDGVLVVVQVGGKVVVVGIQVVVSVEAVVVTEVVSALVSEAVVVEAVESVGVWGAGVVVEVVEAVVTVCGWGGYLDGVCAVSVVLMSVGGDLLVEAGEELGLGGLYGWGLFWDGVAGEGDGGVGVSLWGGVD